jgi:hypothetical protein
MRLARWGTRMLAPYCCGRRGFITQAHAIPGYLGTRTPIGHAMQQEAASRHRVSNMA